jgi:hypothetical protein
MTSRTLRNYILLPVAIAACASFSQAQTGSTIQILQTDPSIVYTGTWYPNYESPNIGGSATLTNDKGATAALSFTGTGITWIGLLDPYSGIAQVYLDGTPNTVDTYGPTTLYQQPLFSVHGLAPGTHTLSIQVLHQRDGETNGSWIWINAFNIENGSGIVGGVSASTGRIEQNNPAIIYTGNWYLNTNPIMSGGTAALAMDPNSSATVTFNGTAIAWIGYQDQWSGIAKLYLDGTLQSPPVDTYAASQRAQSSVYSIVGLSPGPHTLMIVVTGTHDAASAGSWIWVDAFNVM